MGKKPHFLWASVSYSFLLKQSAPSLQERLRAYDSCGPIIGKVFVFLAALTQLLVLLLECLVPRSSIEIAEEWR
eukprot:m.94171 g.94171  ORF g.94171 m.94171 type:complete len:74 (+) comp18361_c0_seq5:35-256(+)